MKRMQCTIVTPEKKVVACEAHFAAIPLQDGEVGISPGRSPLVGQLGRGELRITRDGGEREIYYVEGGFVEVADDVITVLTDFATLATRMRVAKLEIDLEVARNMPSTGPDAAKRREAIDRSKAMLRIARKYRHPV